MAHPHATLSPRQLAGAIGAVALGGGIGCLVRDLALKLQPAPGATWETRVPWILLVINALGVYAATLLLRGPLRHHDPNDRSRLYLVTGLLGGLTSYSSLFVDVAALWHVSALAGATTVLVALLSGVGAAALGLIRHRHT